jgi:Family of unknown function (DUF6788)
MHVVHAGVEMKLEEAGIKAAAEPRHGCGAKGSGHMARSRRQARSCCPQIPILSVDLTRGVTQDMKRGEPLPKITGSLHLEFKSCGRRQCRCQRGLLHGPYVYQHWREHGRQRKAYVQMQRLGEVLLTMEQHRAAAANPGRVNQMLKELHRPCGERPRETRSSSQRTQREEQKPPREP